MTSGTKPALVGLLVAATTAYMSYLVAAESRQRLKCACKFASKAAAPNDQEPGAEEGRGS